jgi:hypothetical protein
MKGVSKGWEGTKQLLTATEPVFVTVYGAQEIDSGAGTKSKVVVPARQAGNRFLVSLKGLQIPALVPLALVMNKFRRPPVLIE